VVVLRLGGLDKKPSKNISISLSVLRLHLSGSRVHGSRTPGIGKNMNAQTTGLNTEIEIWYHMCCVISNRKILILIYLIPFSSSFPSLLVGYLV